VSEEGRRTRRITIDEAIDIAIEEAVQRAIEEIDGEIAMGDGPVTAKPQPRQR
jgi:hypothetical protein